METVLGFDMASITDEVHEEMRRFRAALPQLRETLEGRWVVFYEGKVVSDHATDDECLHAATVNPGEDAPFVVVRVAEEIPVVLSACSLYAIELHL